MCRGFVNLKELCLGCDSLMLLFLPLLQRSLPNSVFLPALQSLQLENARFQPPSDSLPRVADFLRWRGEQGFPVQKVHIADSWINRRSLPSVIQVQDTVLEIDNSNYSYENEEEDYNWNLFPPLIFHLPVSVFLNPCCFRFLKVIFS